MTSAEGRKLFGQELRLKRIAMNLKYREAAAKGGISMAMIHAIETGSIEKPSVATIRGIQTIYLISRRRIERVYFG